MMGKKICVYTVLTALGIIAVFGGLFMINGLILAHGEHPISGTTSHPPKPNSNDSHEIKIMAYNIAKGFMHEGGIRFQDEEIVQERMKRIAEIIRKEQPDMVFLSEAVFECTPWSTKSRCWQKQQACIHGHSGKITISACLFTG